MAPAGLGHMQPLRVIIAGDTGIMAAVALSDTGKYVPVDTRNIDTGIAEPGEDEAQRRRFSGVRLYQSLYETALRNNVPNTVIQELVRIYSYDVDFERKVQPGDRFDVLYCGRREQRRPAMRCAMPRSPSAARPRNIIASRPPTTASTTTTTRTASAPRSSWCASRSPTASVTSGFGWRTHPMLHVSELHTGVDWGAPFGTPIFAAGNGEIDEIGLKGGYGKYVRIRHANGYETAYGHMTAFARGLNVGSRVRQGQVIGFVGSSGLSTGSHVHFEIIVNDRFVDPMRIKLPRGRVLDGATLALFDKDRDELDAVLSHATRPMSRRRASTALWRCRGQAALEQRRPSPAIPDQLGHVLRYTSGACQETHRFKERYLVTHTASTPADRLSAFEPAVGAVALQLNAAVPGPHGRRPHRHFDQHRRRSG